MALSRKGKIIIAASVAVLLVIIIIASIFATRTDTPEVTVIEIKTLPQLRSTVTAPGEITPDSIYQSDERGAGTYRRNLRQRRRFSGKRSAAR